METCAYLGCADNTPAKILVWVFVGGGSYPLFVCSDEHFEGLRAAGAENEAEVVRAKPELAEMLEKTGVL